MIHLTFAFFVVSFFFYLTSFFLVDECSQPIAKKRKEEKKTRFSVDFHSNFVELYFVLFLYYTYARIKIFLLYGHDGDDDRKKPGKRVVNDKNEKGSECTATNARKSLPRLLSPFSLFYFVTFEVKLCTCVCVCVCVRTYMCDPWICMYRRSTQLEPFAYLLSI